MGQQQRPLHPHHNAASDEHERIHYVSCIALGEHTERQKERQRLNANPKRTINQVIVISHLHLIQSKLTCKTNESEKCDSKRIGYEK